jgi:hypothetical protein
MHCTAHQRSCQVHQQSQGMLLSCMALGLILALGGCGSGGARDIFKDPSGAPIKDTVRTAVPLAYAASVAFASVAGSRPPNAWVSNRCPIYPCAAMVTITDDDSTMPLRLASLGTIRVYGFWNSPDKAILSVSFSGAAASDPISTVSLVPVSRSTSSLRVMYGGVNMTSTVTDPQTLSAAEIDLIYMRLQSTVSTEVSDNTSMDAWEVVRNDRGTTDVSDDTYSISGGGEYIETGPGSVSILVLAMAGVMMGPDCALNPTSGAYMVNEFSNDSPIGVVANAFIGFHSACDGKADVSLASGNYMLSIGKSIPLNFGAP